MTFGQEAGIKTHEHAKRGLPIRQLSKSESRELGVTLCFFGEYWP